MRFEVERSPTILGGKGSILKFVSCFAECGQTSIRGIAQDILKGESESGERKVEVAVTGSG